MKKSFIYMWIAVLVIAGLAGVNVFVDDSFVRVLTIVFVSVLSGVAGIYMHSVIQAEGTSEDVDIDSEDIL